ncbi:MAG: putative quinol monooxygenase [Candidatus Paceibacteria bacterium]
MNKFSILGELVAIPGKREELLEILVEAKELLEKKNPDCHLYSLNTAEDTPDSIFVYEIWTDEASHSNSLLDQEVLTLIMKGKPLVQDMKQHYTFVNVA